MLRRSFLPLFFIILSFATYAQDKAFVYGTLRDSANKPIQAVNVAVVGLPGGATSNKNGEYELEIPADKEVTIAFTFLGYKTEKISVKLERGARKQLEPKLKTTVKELSTAVIEDRETRNSNITKLDVKNVSVIANPSGNFESIIKTLPGVTSNNELSSQYSVRGGNFDENLVYVNDVEIYRPFLVRTGQQEGLSFVNSDMVSDVSFSAGGFDAKYGDKMSSVLDIKYKRPVKFEGNGSFSLLGGNLTLEGRSNNSRFTYLAGFRQKSTQNLLGKLDTKADYRPSFMDFQTYLTYAITDKWEVAFLGNYSGNKYNYIPRDRETHFGTVNQALRLKVYFDGQEIDSYDTYTGAFTTTFQPNNKLKLKFITSLYNANELESYDIQGQYYIDEIEQDISKDNFGDVKQSRGVGTYLNHSRTRLFALVYNAEHKGYLSLDKHYVLWGLRLQGEEIADNIRQWQLIDSAGFSQPKPSSYYYPDNSQAPVSMQEVINSSISMNSKRYSAYIQDSYYFNDSRFNLTAGFRGGYWNINKEFYAGPRAVFSFKPIWQKNMIFRASAGYYYQPPFYKELRDLQGNVNRNVKAQTSIHFVTGGDYIFTLWKRPFKYTAEAYYKILNNLVPYKVDNVRVRYYANNESEGYATGVDMRLNGEFVSGAESWASISYMKTEENLKNDAYYIRYNKKGEEIIPGYTFDSKAVDSTKVSPGYIPRPTDQRVTFSMFFQDYVPRYPTFKVSLTLVYGTGLPFGPPGYDKYKDVLRMPAYRRVDIGFSKQLLGEKTQLPPKMQALKHIKSMWISVEVFNLLGVNNTVSYLWVEDITNRQYAVPNYLTNRLINARLVAKF